jgi:translation initiation factor 4G
LNSAYITLHLTSLPIAAPKPPLPKRESAALEIKEPPPEAIAAAAAKKKAAATSAAPAAATAPATVVDAEETKAVPVVPQPQPPAVVAAQAASTSPTETAVAREEPSVAGAATASQSVDKAVEEQPKATSNAPSAAVAAGSSISGPVPATQPGSARGSAPPPPPKVDVEAAAAEANSNDGDNDVDDWETAEVPAGGAPAADEEEEEEGPGLSADGRKVYSRDYLKKMAVTPACMVKMSADVILAYSEELLMDEPRPFEDWSGRSGRSGAGTPNYSGGRGGEEWGGGGVGSTSLHRTGNRYVAGVTQSADPDEEKKQRTFKGILNKLTIDNFEKLSKQVGANCWGCFVVTRLCMSVQ